MSLSSTALKQREKEAKALRSLLIYSLFGSVVLHIVVLALCLSNFLMKFPKVKDEPIEVTLIEVPNQEVINLLSDRTTTTACLLTSVKNNQKNSI
jgi:hypothetical protein